MLPIRVAPVAGVLPTPAYDVSALCTEKNYLFPDAAIVEQYPDDTGEHNGDTTETRFLLRTGDKIYAQKPDGFSYLAKPLGLIIRGPLPFTPPPPTPFLLAFDPARHSVSYPIFTYNGGTGNTASDWLPLLDGLIVSNGTGRFITSPNPSSSTEFSVLNASPSGGPWADMKSKMSIMGSTEFTLTTFPDPTANVYPLLASTDTFVLNNVLSSPTQHPLTIDFTYTLNLSENTNPGFSVARSTFNETYTVNPTATLTLCVMACVTNQNTQMGSPTVGGGFVPCVVGTPFFSYPLASSISTTLTFSVPTLQYNTQTGLFTLPKSAAVTIGYIVNTQ